MSMGKFLIPSFVLHPIFELTTEKQTLFPLEGPVHRNDPDATPLSFLI